MIRRRFSTMRALAASLGVIGAFAAAPAGAVDLAVYGGRQFDEDVFAGDFSVITVSVGVESPEWRSPLGPDHFRLDMTYGFRESTFVDDNLNAEALGAGLENVFDDDFVYVHLGPSWSTRELLGPFRLSLTPQIGFVHRDIRRFTRPGTVRDNFSDTSFSWQVPVAADFRLSEHFSLTARYRLLGVVRDGGDTDNVVEGGLRYTF